MKSILIFSILALSSPAYAWKLLNCSNERVGFYLSREDEGSVSEYVVQDKVISYQKFYGFGGITPSHRFPNCNDEFKIATLKGEKEFYVCYFHSQGSGYSEMINPLTEKLENLNCRAYELKE